MKNVILTHKELQLNLFLAVTYGLQNHDFGPNLHLVYEITERDFVWKVVEHATGKPLFYCYINKGDYQMNDLRLGVTVCYIRDQAETFLSDFNKFKQGIPKGGTHPSFKFPDLLNAGSERISDGSENKIGQAGNA
jgi:hypothetical protein